MLETWKPIPGFEGFYEASDQGRIARVNSRLRNEPRFIRKPSLLSSGYLIVSLCVEGKKVHRKVHTLVLLAFFGPRPEEKTINHKNGDKTDNKLKNLEYVTPRENSLHASLTGLHPRGERVNTCKLKGGDVEEIVRLYFDEGCNVKELARRFHVQPGNIWHIIRGLSWKHVDRKGRVQPRRYKPRSS